MGRLYREEVRQRERADAAGAARPGRRRGPVAAVGADAAGRIEVPADAVRVA
jgi:hypothetical protein